MSDTDKNHQSSIPLDHEYVELPIPHRWEMTDEEIEGELNVASTQCVERVFHDRMLDHTGDHCNRNADRFPKIYQRDYRKKNRGRVDKNIRESLRGSWLCRERQRGRHFVPRKPTKRM